MVPSKGQVHKVILSFPLPLLVSLRRIVNISLNVSLNPIGNQKYLLSLENIDISLKNNQEQTALDIAVTNDNREMLELFQNYFETQATKTFK